ncbi:NAD(P)-binding domain-containing protein [Paenibacillus sp. N4]|uniref:NAD(P)-binding domain-containing protein n=1 Tax=Paenibacillus vietnamensis TaxID=2590547 RepID=UPI001CD1283A|nr:NAD(P)-binding domain-containing protein [Paenibacillus vietnamensis]MCA0756053.1 NAD(P)-binding domain-containing protein [Paenibacillus vietnamensis]
MTDLIIIGAGPYGISLAAHARAIGLSYVLLGEPMHFWKEQMPQNMFIRTNPRYISLSDYAGVLTIERYSEETGTPLVSPFPRPDFVDYAFWFARHAGVVFTPELAASVDYSSSGFTVTTNAGKQLASRHVVVATGLQHFSYIPDVLSGLPPSLVTHTFGQTGFERFHGQSVAVIGSGQSAWEAAALLHMAGSRAELLFRREAVQYAGEDNTASGLKLIESAEQFYRLPPEQKQERWNTPRQGSVALFLKPYVEGKVKATGHARIEKAEAAEGGKALLTLSGGETRVFDHVIAATGYRIDLDLVPFLPRYLLATIERERGGFSRFPLLSEHFESSVPGLFFAGPLASHTHGPAFGFVAGLRQACRSIISCLVTA